MADNIIVRQGKLVSDSSLIPYIRAQEIQFDADNLRPNKTASIFFDDIAVNMYCQKGNQIVLNTKKSVVITPNTGASIVAGYVAWQYIPGVTGGDVFKANTFSGIVESYDTSTKTLILNSLSGQFDDELILLISLPSGSQRKATCNIESHASQNTADTFNPGEQIYCQNNNVYMTVIGTSGENILYVNENYIYANVGRTSGTLLDTNFKRGDLVFQTNKGIKDIQKATFTGYVEYFKTATGANTLSIVPVKGVLYSNTNTTNTKASLHNQTNPAAPTIKVFRNVSSNIAANNIIRSIDDASKKVDVVAHYHSSGVIRDSKTNSDKTQIRLGSVNLDLARDNTIRITSGTGLGQARRILSVATDGSYIVIGNAFENKLTTNTRYTIGNHSIDDNGSISGIFNVPEEADIAFKTGERIFTITDSDTIDDENYTMKASAKFTASGILNKTQRISTIPVSRPMSDYTLGNPVAALNPTQRTYANDIQESPVVGSSTGLVPRIKLADGLSQTFFTPKTNTNKTNRGIFVTSVDLFFFNKPKRARGEKEFPIMVKITEVSNGYPTKNYIATSDKVDAKDVKVSASPSVDSVKTETKFKFKDPVYLEPESEYAITIFSQAPEYEVYIATLGGAVLNANPPRRISEQPYAGSLFKSQNASTWTAYQNQDLMFVINKAVFETEGSVIFGLKRAASIDMEVGKLMIHTNDLEVSSSDIKYSIKGKKENTLTGVVSDDSYVKIRPNELLHYGDIVDESTKKSPTSGVKNYRLLEAGNRESYSLKADFTTIDPNISPVLNKESASVLVFEYLINDAGIANSDITVANRGDGYRSVNSSGNVVYGSSSDTLNTAAQFYREDILANNYSIAFYKVAISSNVGSGASAFAVANTDGSNSISYIVMTDTGSGYYENATATVSAPNDTTKQNEARLIYQGEVGVEGGNIWSKYLTRKFELLDGFDSGDLVVFMDVIKPAGTDIQVYYKVLGIDDFQGFDEKTWVRMKRKVNIVSKDSRELVELQYKPSLTENKLSYMQNGIEHPIGGSFTTFAIKVCLTSSDAAIVPYVRNLRISAVPSD